MKAKKASKAGIVVAIAGVLAVAALAVNIGRNVQEQVEEPTQTLETEDFVFERKSINFTSDMTLSDGLKVSMDYRLSPEKVQEIMSAENKTVYVLSTSYTTWIEPFLNQGYTYEEVIEAALSSRAESDGKTLDEFLLLVYNTGKSQGVRPKQTVDEYGEVGYVLSMNATGLDSYNSVNKPFVGIGLILTNNDGEISYEVGSLGGKSLSDVEVSGSMAYLSSLYLNQSKTGEQAYNATVTQLCTKAVHKAYAQASGYTEEEYESGVVWGEPIESGTTITMKVGETKKFEPKQLIDVQLRIDYLASYTLGEDNNGQGYTIDSVGNIQALKAGTYKVGVLCAGSYYYYTLNITQ